MPEPRFLQIHTLTPYSATRLNSDEGGSAKKMPYGSSMRTRISSQAMKRRWRDAEDRYSLRNLGVPMGYRSRVAVERRITGRLRATTEEARKVVETMTRAFAHRIYGERGDTIQGRQPLVLGEPELDFLREHAERIFAAHSEDEYSAKAAVDDLFAARGDERANLRAFRESARLVAGVEGAMFGRLVTSDPAANIDGAIHVAHALTVHQEESELDYFTVVDDMLNGSEPGTAHIGESELTSGLFYGYVVVDVPTLVSNTEGYAASQWREADRELAGRIAQHLVHLIATVSPGANKGATAPYSYAEFMLVEAGDRQPRSLASAFRSPVRAHTGEAVAALADHLSKMDGIYGSDEGRRYLSVEDTQIPRATKLSLSDLADWTAETIETLEV